MLFLYMLGYLGAEICISAPIFLILCPNPKISNMQNLHPHHKEVEMFTTFLTSRRLRKTPERFEILHCALDYKGHFDADCLYHSLEEKGYHVSKATIYSTIELLCSSGIIRRLLFDTHQARYERASLTHCHLICTECGEINEINLEEVDISLADMKIPYFTPVYVSTCIYGICDKCRKMGKVIK